MLARQTALVLMVLLCASAPALAADTPAPTHPDIPPIDTGNTAWVLASAGLVMLMTPGLAFFYGGLVRRKNILSILMQCMTVLCLVTLQWVAFGYSLSFGPDVGGVIGNLDWAFLNNVGAAPNETYAKTIPHTAFMIFQAMFAIITPGLILGAFAERMRFSAFCLFSLLWATVIYDPVCHWVWGDGGFLAKMGVMDFAGGIVVHVTAGVSALAAALFLGRRQGYPHTMSPPHNLPLAVLGAGLLWFGWFGFNAGSALSAGWMAAGALVATHIAGAAAGVTWSILDWGFNKRPTMLGMITGAVAGLAAVTPASGYVGPMAAAAIGVVASIVCWLAVTFLKSRLKYDDSLDAFGVHGIGGMWGVLATGLWASSTVNWEKVTENGLFAGGGTHLFLVQAMAVGLVSVVAFVGTMVLLKLVDLVVGIRVTEHEERVGLDLTQHREAGYTLVD
jgi:ammonium transporter, Amt family